MRVPRIFLKCILLSALLITAAAFASAEKNVMDEGIEAFYAARYQQAEAYFQARLEDSEVKVEALMYLSRIALARGDTEQAVEHIEEAIEISANNIEALILAGDVYCQHAQDLSIFRALKTAKRCIAQYESVIELDSENIEALMAATRFHLHAPSVAGGSNKKAREYKEKLIQLSREHGIAVKIEWHEKEGEREAALKLADHLTENGIEFAQNQYDIGKYYRDVEAYDKALPLFEALSAREKTYPHQWIIHDSLLQAGEIYIKQGEDIAKGVALIEAYKQVNNNPHDVHYFWSTWSLAKGYKALGREDKYEALVSDIQSQEYSRDKAFAKEFEGAL